MEPGGIKVAYNRQGFVRDPDTAKRVARLNPRHEWVTREVTGLRIVDNDLWERGQALKQRHSSRWGNKRQTKSASSAGS